MGEAPVEQGLEVARVEAQRGCVLLDGAGEVSRLAQCIAARMVLIRAQTLSTLQKPQIVASVYFPQRAMSLQSCNLKQCTGVLRVPQELLSELPVKQTCISCASCILTLPQCETQQQKRIVCAPGQVVAQGHRCRRRRQWAGYPVPAHCAWWRDRCSGRWTVSGSAPAQSGTSPAAPGPPSLPRPSRPFHWSPHQRHLAAWQRVSCQRLC